MYTLCAAKDTIFIQITFVMQICHIMSKSLYDIRPTRAISQVVKEEVRHLIRFRLS